MKGDRQRLLCAPSLEHQGLKGSVALGLTSLCFHLMLYPAPAIGAMSPNLLLDTGSEHGVQLGVGHEASVVPPFRASSRDRSHGLIAAQWRPSQNVRLDGSWSWIQDRLPSGDSPGGPGDLHLSTYAKIWEGPWTVGLGWMVKLPNARDETELGSDETDVSFQGTLSKSWTSITFMSGMGIEIMGDPLRFANQDDAALLWGGVASNGYKLRWFSRMGGTLKTARNPARSTIDFGANYGCPTTIGVGASTGLTPAAPSWGGRIWLGFGLGCD